TVPGTYTLFVKADGGAAPIGGTATDAGRIAEANEANNTQALPITLPGKPDLTVSAASAGAITVNANGSYNIPITWTVTNVGGATAVAGWYDVGYLSTDATLDNADLYVGALYHNVALAAGANYTASMTYITATTTVPGTYTLF